MLKLHSWLIHPFHHNSIRRYIQKNRAMSTALRAISRTAAAAAKRSTSVQAAHAQAVPAVQPLAHTQLRTMASKSDKEEPEKLSGPLAKLMSIYEHFKGQIVEDNVHYEKAKPYQAPRDKRREKVERAARKIEADDKSSGVVVHEASRIEQQWKSFKESNAIANGLFNLRERYDESDNVVVRKARDVADSLSGVLSSLMESQDHSAVLTEIRRLDPTFDTLNFTVHLQHKVIPAVLEAFSDGDIETLRGWCTEACSIHLENVINSRKEAGLFYESRILDLDNVEVSMHLSCTCFHSPFHGTDTIITHLLSFFDKLFSAVDTLVSPNNPHGRGSSADFHVPDAANKVCA
eukprot:m.259039 g.259039  ORF g.259039 m.259039 type:complete len:348 (+) comp15549_c1_seq16:232-1275(+)